LRTIHQKDFLSPLLNLISGFVDTYLRLNVEEEAIFQAEIVRLELVQKEVVMEIVTSWMETGIQRGRQEQTLALIMRQLTRKIVHLNLSGKNVFEVITKSIRGFS
jgi:hypothetical protein